MPNKAIRQTRWLLLVSMVAVFALGVLTIAYAQSGASKFNLNSPAAFPVDI